MSMEYIRKTYGVPAKRGARIEYSGDDGARLGTIIGTRNAYIKVRFDDSPIHGNLHPTWKVRYLPPGNCTLPSSSGLPADVSHLQS